MKKRKNKKENRPFSLILSALMAEKDMTVREASKIAEVSISTISDWKNGASPEDYLAVQKLANSLGVSLSFILTGIEDTQRVSNVSVTEVFENGEYLFDGYAKITIQRLIPRKKKGECDE